MRIHVEVKNFPAPAYSAWNHATAPRPVSPYDLMLASVTVGKTDWRGVIAGGWRRFCEYMGHSLHIAAFVEATPAGLGLSPLFEQLDQSEMIGVSYRLGMALTQVVAQQEMSIPWLTHVDRLVATGAAVLTPGQRGRGDLAGQDSAFRWHVIESKGRSNPPSKQTYSDAKAQAAQVISIGGAPPATNSACVSDLSQNPFHVILDDPPPEKKRRGKVSIQVDQGKFFREYYALAELLIAHQPRRFVLPGANQQATFLVSEIEGTDYFLGVHNEIGHELVELESGKFQWLRGWSERWRDPLIGYQKNAADRPEIGLGADGYCLVHRNLLQRSSGAK